MERRSSRTPAWPESAATTERLERLVASMHLELVPTPSVERAISELAPRTTVSVTCSPVGGIPPTLDLADRLARLGHRPVPHLAARKVTGAAHVSAIVERLRTNDVRDVFVIAGDAPEPDGPYEGASALLADLVTAGSGVERIGIAGYPDGHALIDPAVLDEQLHLKQSMLRAAGLDGWISTQMCFDPTTIGTWLERIRADGITLPVHLGIPGLVDRVRLMKMGTRLGLGASLRFLSKNRSAAIRLMAPGRYDPTELLDALAPDADRLGIAALHSFTFNAVAETRSWQESFGR